MPPATYQNNEKAGIAYIFISFSFSNIKNTNIQQKYNNNLFQNSYAKGKVKYFLTLQTYSMVVFVHKT